MNRNTQYYSALKLKRNLSPVVIWARCAMLVRPTSSTTPSSDRSSVNRVLLGSHTFVSSSFPLIIKSVRLRLWILLLLAGGKGGHSFAPPAYELMLIAIKPCREPCSGVFSRVTRTPSTNMSIC